MPRPLLHPPFRQLSRYADDDLGPRLRRAVGRHLERCARCRALLQRLHGVDAQARALAAPPLPPAVRERLLARHAAGEATLLPTAEAPAPWLHRRRGWTAAAAAVLLALAGTSLLLPRGELEGSRSELVFSPAAPRAGQAVQVAYRGGSLFGGQERLRLRARYLRGHDLPIPGVGRQATVAELVRGADGVFRATLQLPDSVVYGAFAVEDAAGERVDSRGRQLWELLVHGPDGRPRFEALAQRQFDHQASHWELSRQNAQEAAALYPGRVDAWFNLYLNERSSLSGPAADSARSRARARLAEFDRAFRARTHLDVESELGIITRLADAVGDTARHRYWRTRLLRSAPGSLWGVQERFLDLVPVAQRDPRRALATLDSMWSEIGPGRPAVIYVPVALSLAESTGDPEAIRLWADRLVRANPEEETGAALAAHPALREEGLARLRARLRALDRVDHAVRPLERGVAEERLARAEEGRRVLATLGAALLESGRRAAALDTLERATRTGWDAALFRRVAELRLQGGDTAGAAAPLALAATDPLAGAALRDSARLLLGRHGEPAAWSAHLARARQEMRERVLARAVGRALPGRIRLRDAEGRPVELGRLAAGRPVFVAFWSRYCPPSAQQLPRLQRVAALLRAQGHVVVTVAEEPTPEFRRFLRENGLTLPVYTDPHRELSRALAQWGVPDYFVVDGGGTLRFGPLRELSAVPAQMAVAAELGGATDGS